MHGKPFLFFGSILLYIMDSIGTALIIGFLIGLSGALAPGPTLVATIRSSLKGGWTVGPKISAGHAIVEAVVVCVVVLGVASVAEMVSVPVAVVGGQYYSCLG